MSIGIRNKRIPIDHINKIFLTELHYENDNKKSLTFCQNAGCELVSYERLKEIHDLIGETLKHEQNYRKCKEDYDARPIEEPKFKGGKVYDDKK